MTWFTSAKPHPDPHLPLGWRLKAFDHLDSTSAALKRMVESGTDLAEGLTVWAGSQTAGRGRGGRGWESPHGNLYASILVSAPDLAAAPQLGFVAALAVRDAVLELPRHNAPPPPLKLKWPNDVLIEGAKCSGILLEADTDTEARAWVIVGIGLNLKPVNITTATYPVTALVEHGVDTTPAHALTALARCFAAWMGRWRKDGFAPVRDEWLRSGPAIGDSVRVKISADIVTGTFAGLDADGALLLDTGAERRRVLAGEVLMSGRI